MRNGATRREFLKAGAAGLCVLTLGVRPAAAEARKRPNVLIITTDQQRVDAMSAAGNKWVKTPNLDALAASGICFTQSYCAYPLCSPSRSALHTGRTPHEISVDHNRMPIDPAMPLSGQLFRDAGYDTGYAGKWHMPEVYPTDGIAGFEVLNKASRQRKLACDVDEATMTDAIEFLKRKRDRPFLLTVSFINPHDICLLAGETSALLEDVQKKYFPAAGAELPPLPANFANTAGEPAQLAKRPRHEQWDEAHWRKYVYAYYRLMEDVDRQVGQVLEALRQAGQEDNTLIIFTSDHGEGLASHRWTGKMMFYEEEAAVPLIVCWKGVTPPKRIDRRHLVSTLDVLPTICDYAGLAPPPLMRGESLRTVIEKPDAPGHEFVASEISGGMGGKERAFMIRTKKYKYIAFPAAGGAERAEMLLDLESDPGEMKNLAADAAIAAELERHRKLLDQWKKATEEDKYPIKSNPVARQKQKRANAKKQK